MEKYINKNAIVAKIKELIRVNEIYLSKSKTDEVRFQKVGAYSVLNDLLHFLDTLEVKEVNLEKELNKLDSTLYDMDGVAIDDNTDCSETRYITVEDIKDLAKHFFELGINYFK